MNTCAGAPKIPTEKPAITLPASKMKCDFADANRTQPKINGTDIIINVGRRPILSIKGPDRNDPNGFAILCMLAKSN